MSLIERIKEKAKSSVKTIVLPEGDEARTIQAAAIVQREGIAKPILLGNEQLIRLKAEELKVNLSDIRIVDPAGSPEHKRYAEALYELRSWAMRMVLFPARFIRPVICCVRHFRSFGRSRV